MTQTFDSRKIGKNLDGAGFIPTASAGVVDSCFVEFEPDAYFHGRNAVASLLSASVQGAVEAQDVAFRNGSLDFQQQIEDRGTSSFAIFIALGISTLWGLLQLSFRRNYAIYATFGLPFSRLCLIRTLHYSLCSIFSFSLPVMFFIVKLVQSDSYKFIGEGVLANMMNIILFSSILSSIANFSPVGNLLTHMRSRS